MNRAAQVLRSFRASEDFALEPVPQTSRTRRAIAILNVLLGIPTALVFFATGAELEAIYNTANLVAGIAIATVIISVAACILTLFAQRSGLDSDLSSIPAGFGLRGSALTSAIYSGTFFILFALEDDIIATAVHSQYPALPRWAILLVVGLILVALNWQGIAALTVTMAATLPVFLVLIGAFVARASTPREGLLLPAAHERLSVHGTVAVGGVLMAFIVNATVSADVGRFLGATRGRARPIMLGVSLQLISFIGSVGLGAWMQRSLGVSNPGSAFVIALGGWGVLAVTSSQLRINLINLYAGSLSLSNFGRRAFGWRPGRVSWSVVIAIAGTGLALTDIYLHLLDVLTFEAVFTCAWVGVLVAAVLRRNLLSLNIGDIASVKAFDVSGLTSLLLALAITVPLAFGAAGEFTKNLAPFIAIVCGSSFMSVADAFQANRGDFKRIVGHKRSGL